MAQLLVRGLEERVVERLKARAKQNGRSLQGEVKAIIEQAAKEPSWEEFHARLKVVHKMLEGRSFSDSAELIRQDRER